MGHVEDRLALLKAWTAWDDRPGDQQRTYNMCVAVNVYSEFLGVSGTELRVKLAEFRRESMLAGTLLSREACVDAITLEVEIERDMSV